MFRHSWSQAVGMHLLLSWHQPHFRVFWHRLQSFSDRHRGYSSGWEKEQSSIWGRFISATGIVFLVLGVGLTLDMGVFFIDDGA